VRKIKKVLSLAVEDKRARLAKELLEATLSREREFLRRNKKK